MKVLHKIILILSILAALAAALVYDAFYASVNRYSVRYETLSSVAVPEQMNDVSILFFSDLDYGTFMNKERFDKLVDTINELCPDIIIFGGDMFDIDVPYIASSYVDEITDGLKRMKAPLGKFAVLGDFDYRSSYAEKMVRQILYDADFELLYNSSVLLRNTGSASVSLTGIDSGLSGHPDINAAFANVSRSAFNLVVCHTPDTASDVPADLTDYYLTGHSHGGQAYWFLGALYTPEMAEEYFRGKTTVRDIFTVDISYGVGTTIKDVRFLCNAEVVMYRLKHTDILSQ